MNTRDFLLIGKKINDEVSISVEGNLGFALFFYKDACIHLRNLKKNEGRFLEGSDGRIEVMWRFDTDSYQYFVKHSILSHQYKEIPFTEFMSILKNIYSNFDSFFSFTYPKILNDESFKIEPHKNYFFSLMNVLNDKNYIGLPKSLNHGDFNSMLVDIVKNCYTDSPITIKTVGFSFNEIKAAFDYAFSKLNLRNAKHKSLIDFKELIFTGDLDYDYI